MGPTLAAHVNPILVLQLDSHGSQIGSPLRAMYYILVPFNGSMLMVVENVNIAFFTSYKNV